MFPAFSQTSNNTVISTKNILQVNEVKEDNKVPNVEFGSWVQNKIQISTISTEGITTKKQIMIW
jgi:hypothetical protein